MLLAHVYVFPTLSISYVLIHLTRKTDCDIIIIVVVPSLSCPTLCNPMDCSTPGFPVLYYLLEFTQTHVHRVDDAILLSHPVSPPSPLALNLSQHQGLFQ